MCVSDRPPPLYIIGLFPLSICERPCHDEKRQTVLVLGRVVVSFVDRGKPEQGLGHLQPTPRGLPDFQCSVRLARLSKWFPPSGRQKMRHRHYETQRTHMGFRIETSLGQTKDAAIRPGETQSRKGHMRGMPVWRHSMQQMTRETFSPQLCTCQKWSAALACIFHARTPHRRPTEHSPCAQRAHVCVIV